jgi:uncharacterized repeat protein (TIGR03803 family)
MADRIYRRWWALSLLILVTALHAFADPQGGKKGCTSVCYGQTYAGGAQNDGIFYSLTASGKSAQETPIYSFGQSGDGQNPIGDLVPDANGNFYGTTYNGGIFGFGTVFELSPEAAGGCPAASNTGNGWCETVLYNFESGIDGANPSGGVTSDAKGNLYGATMFGAGYGVIFELSQSGGQWTEQVLYTFNYTDGAYPNGGLAIDSSGNLYGTTNTGGADNSGGVIFELSQSGGQWTEQVLYNFDQLCQYCGVSTGSVPVAGVVLYNGSLFGTTSSGGSSVCFCGVVYELSPSSGSGWTYTLIHQFTLLDGAGPTELLLNSNSGNVYGTTQFGGMPAGCYYNLAATNGFITGAAPETLGCGTVFEVSSIGGLNNFSVLYRFAGGLDGSNPEAELFIDSSGNLYGTTYFGGGTGCDMQNGCGTVFELTPLAGGVWTESILNRFDGTDGALPRSGLGPSN